MSPARRWALLLVAGALVATAGDHLHVIYGVLDYPHPVLFRQAWWVFPLFVGATAAMMVGVEDLRRRMGGAAVATSKGDVILATGAFFVAYAFTALAAELPNFVLVALVLAWLARVRALPRWVFAWGVLAAAVGVSFESALSRLGGFYYIRPDFLLVPRWLPALYLHASLAAVRVRGMV